MFNPVNPLPKKKELNVTMRRAYLHFIWLFKSLISSTIAIFFEKVVPFQSFLV